MQRFQVHSHQPSVNPSSQDSTIGSLHWCMTQPFINKSFNPFKCQKCGKENHFKAVCKSGEGKRDHRDFSKSRQKKGKGKIFYEVNEDDDGVMNDLSEQVQSLFYNDVHFNAVNKRMHTLIDCETPDGRLSQQTFKIDTGADGNLMPITMFTKLFPKVSLEALGRMVDKSVKLYTYSNTAIKQFGTCQIRLKFNGSSFVCKFYVVEHETAIVGISDAERLRLVRVNFDTVRDVKVIHEKVKVKHLRTRLKETTHNYSKELALWMGRFPSNLKVVQYLM